MIFKNKEALKYLEYRPPQHSLQSPFFTEPKYLEYRPPQHSLQSRNTWSIVHPNILYRAPKVVCRTKNKEKLEAYASSFILARVAGFEPAHDGIRIRCLTAWRYPNN